MKMNKKYMYSFVALLAVSLVSAGLIQYYGQITQEINVEQSVVLSGDDIVCNSVAGDTLTDCDFSVKNNANVDAMISLETTCSSPVDSGDNCDGVSTEVYGVLELTQKDINTWTPSGDTIKISYTITGNNFEYEVVDGTVPSGYELVYAMDKENRFNDYATVKTIAEITESLPMTGDWNAIADPDYGSNGFDNYEHTRGAKLWIIPTSDIGANGVLSWANMANYYYETDLIVYSDTNTITLPAGGGFDFCVENNFVVNLMPETYTITTNVVPVVTA